MKQTQNKKEIRKPKQRNRKLNKRKQHTKLEQQNRN